MVSLGQKLKMPKTCNIIFDEEQKNKQTEYMHTRHSLDKWRERSIEKWSAVHSLAQEGA